MSECGPVPVGVPFFGGVPGGPELDMPGGRLLCGILDGLWLDYPNGIEKYESTLFERKT